MALPEKKVHFRFSFELLSFIWSILLFLPKVIKLNLEQFLSVTVKWFEWRKRNRIRENPLLIFRTELFVWTYKTFNEPIIIDHLTHDTYVWLFEIGALLNSFRRDLRDGWKYYICKQITEILRSPYIVKGSQSCWLNGRLKTWIHEISFGTC